MCSILHDRVFNIALKGSFDACQRVVKGLFSDQSWLVRGGGGGDADKVMDGMDTDGKEVLKGNVRLGAVNSINWARILAQTVYYFHAYFSLVRSKSISLGMPVRFSVPTGNFGNVLAGYYARRMGLPISELIVGVNENDIIHRFFESGIYEPSPSSQTGGGGGVKKTVCPAMDIQVSSNFERWLWHFIYDHYYHTIHSQASDTHNSDSDGGLRECGSEDDEEAAGKASECVSKWMKQLKDTGRFVLSLSPPSISTTSNSEETVDQALLEKARGHFKTASITDKEVLSTIKRYSDAHGYILDPHTAIGVLAAERTPNPHNHLTVCLATAHPIKFVDAVFTAISGDGGISSLAGVGGCNGGDIERRVLKGDVKIPNLTVPKGMEGLLDMEQRFVVLDDDVEVVKRYILSTRSQM